MCIKARKSETNTAPTCLMEVFSLGLLCQLVKHNVSVPSRFFFFRECLLSCLEGKEVRSFLRACPHEQVESPDNVEQEDLAVIHLLTGAERHKCTHSQSKQNIEVEVGGRFSTNSGSPGRLSSYSQHVEPGRWLLRVT